MGTDTTSTKGTADLENMRPSPNFPVGYIEWSWTSNATGNVISKTDLPFAGELLRVTTIPSATAAPTANYDITVTDEAEVDVLNGYGANRHTSNTETVYVQKTGSITTASVAVNVTFSDKLELNVTNAGASKKGRIRLYYR